MKDLPGAAEDDDPSTPSEYAQFPQLDARESAHAPVEDQSDEHEEPEAGSEAWRQLVAQARMTLPLYAQQFAAFLGKPIPVEVDWVSVDGDSEALVNLLNFLGPIFGGLMTAGRDPLHRQGIAQHIDRIALRRVLQAGEQVIRLDEGSLIMTVHLDGGAPAQISFEDAATIFKGMIDYVIASNGGTADRYFREPRPAGRGPPPRRQSPPIGSRESPHPAG